MWELNHKEGWMPKNLCFRIVVLEKTLESPFDSKEAKPVNPKGNQPWIFTGRTAAETEAPVLWPSDANSRLIGKDPDAGKEWRWEEKGATEAEMLGWHHQLKGYEFDKLWETLEDRRAKCVLQSMGSQKVRHNLETEQQVQNKIKSLQKRFPSLV